jgi:hypothetical protein
MFQAVSQPKLALTTPGSHLPQAQTGAVEPSPIVPSTRADAHPPSE